MMNEETATKRCRHCIGKTDANLIPAEARLRLLKLAKESDIMGAIKALRKLGFSLGDAKFTFLHIARHGGYCHRCSKPLDDGIEVVCEFCGAFNLDLADSVEDPPPQSTHQFQKIRVAPHPCPQCGKALGPGTTRCWTQGCEYSLPEGSYIDSSKRSPDDL